METILSIKNLYVTFDTEEGVVQAVSNVSFDVPKASTVCIVGESGCGKSVTSFSIMQLIAQPPGKIESGEILFNDIDLLKLRDTELQDIRGKQISMIFQEPMTALNPVISVGKQIDEVLKLHTKYNKKQRFHKVIQLLEEVGIPSANEKYYAYPHQLSGGQRQRIIIAIAIACNPQVLIADEPTTALDVTIQAQILELLARLQQKYHMSIIFITHDLAVVSEIANEIIVMYAGSIVEKSDRYTIFNKPQHPYTQALLKTLPVFGENENRVLTAITGRVQKLINLDNGCRFRNRCPFVHKICHHVNPELKNISQNHTVACHLYSKNNGEEHTHE